MCVIGTPGFVVHGTSIVVVQGQRRRAYFLFSGRQHKLGCLCMVGLLQGFRTHHCAFSEMQDRITAAVLGSWTTSGSLITLNP
jgi:hypothetical protein